MDGLRVGRTGGASLGYDSLGGGGGGIHWGIRGQRGPIGTRFKLNVQELLGGGFDKETKSGYSEWIVRNSEV
jgi:hypothetical protein